MQISSDEKEGSSEDIFTDQELFGSNNCVIAKLERYEGKNEAMSFRMKKSNHRTTDAWRKSILDGSYKLDFDQDFHGKSLVSTYLVIYEDNKLEKNEKCCIVLDANAPLAGQAKSYEVVSDTRIANSSRDDTNLHFNGPVNVMDEDFPNLDALKVKFKYSEKATKFCEISTVHLFDLSYVVTVMVVN